MINKYHIIYADPPWSYQNRSSNGAAENHYSTMSLDELFNMRPMIDEWSDKDAVLVLWVTHPLLPEGLSLMESWGFKFKTTLFNWVKETKNGKIAFGGGNYTRACSELCLLGIRGKGLTRLNRSIRQVQIAKIAEHSRKPDIFRQLIVELWGDRPRIELFAREKAEGWSQFGNEINKFKAGNSALVKEI